MRLSTTLSLVALGCVSGGCGRVYYGPPNDVVDTLVGKETGVVPGNAVAARVSADGTALELRALRMCDHVELEQYERVSVSEAEEDVTAPLVALGLGTAPLTSGAILLADASEVHESDRNARQYNAAGPGGAIAGGVVLVVIGGLFVVPSMVQLVRFTSTRETTSLVKQRGAVIEPGVRCAEETPASGVDVIARLAGGATAYLGRTDASGQLVVDLAQRIPAATLQAARGFEMEVLIREQVVSVVDLGPVARAHRTQRLAADEAAWAEADVDTCRAAASAEACAGVGRYLREHPQGEHAGEGRLLLDLATSGPDAPSPAGPPSATLAVPGPDGARGPDEPAPDAGARAGEAAMQAARNACLATCASACTRAGPDAAQEICRLRCAREACR